MILHCERRQIESCRDFLIRESAGYKPDELELPGSEGLPIATLRIICFAAFLSLLAEVLNQAHAKAWGARGFAAPSCANRRDDLPDRSFFEQVTADSQVDRLQKEVWVLIHAEKKHLDP